MSKIDYKQKYMELKMRYMADVDQAFRLGVEQGIQEEQKNAMAQQQQQQAELQAAMAGQPPGGAPGQDPNAQPGTPGLPDETAPGQNPAGTELDQHIAKLESMMGSGEAKPEEMAKALGELKAYRADQLHQIEMKKSEAAIPGIVKALHKPAFKISAQASHNMTDNAKRAVGMQHKIVEDVMKSWTEEESKASKEISKVLNVEGLVKKE